MELVKHLQDLLKAIEGGNYNAAPSSLTQGAALQREDLSPVMQNVCFQDKQLILTKKLNTESCKSNTWQFIRQLSYGAFGGSAALEGHVGPERTGSWSRVVVPMAYYVDQRRVTEVAMLVDTFDGKKADDRSAEDAAKNLAADIEFDAFRGQDDFSNGGVFDGNPASIPQLPGMHGLGLQIRQSDALRQTMDNMFLEYGGSDSVILAVGGTLTQSAIEDGHTLSVMNHGQAEDLVVDPRVLSTYNKITIGKERIVLAGSAQEAVGANLQKQWVMGGEVKITGSRFLSGKTAPAPARTTTPGIAATLTATSTTTSGVTTPFLAGEVYQYYVTGANEMGGEGGKKFASALTVSADGDEVVLAIGACATGTCRFFNVYRSAAGGSAASAKFIGRVLALAAGTASFNDQGNKLPGFVTGYLTESDTMELRELAPFTRKKLAETDLTHPEVFYRFLTLAVMQPRKNVLFENLSG